MARVRTLMNDCAFIICFEIEREEDVHIKGTGILHAMVARELSNIKSGTALRHIHSTGDSSHIRYQGTIEPEFKVFPIIGEYFARRLKIFERTHMVILSRNSTVKLFSQWLLDSLSLAL